MHAKRAVARKKKELAAIKVARMPVKLPGNEAELKKLFQDISRSVRMLQESRETNTLRYWNMRREHIRVYFRLQEISVEKLLKQITEAKLAGDKKALESHRSAMEGFKQETLELQEKLKEINKKISELSGL